MTDEQLKWIFTLLIIFQFKHFLADYPLQREYMLKKVSPGWDFAPPLVLHCFVHALLTATIVAFYDWRMLWLSVFDFAVHFIMDRIKAGPRYLGRFHDPARSSYWIAFGF